MWWLVLFAMASGPPPLAIDVYPRQQIAHARASVRLRITVEPDDHNRRLAWTYDGENFSSGSERQLDGASAPRTITLILADLPAGHYTVIAALLRTNGVIRVTTIFTILGDEELFEPLVPGSASRPPCHQVPGGLLTWDSQHHLRGMAFHTSQGMHNASLRDTTDDTLSNGLLLRSPCCTSPGDTNKGSQPSAAH